MCDSWEEIVKKAKYLKVMAEYGTTGLYTDTGFLLGEWNCPLPEEIWNELLELREAYSDYHKYSTLQESLVHAERWKRLDRWGLGIARRIALTLDGITEVRYWSEGFMDFVDPESECLQ